MEIKVLFQPNSLTIIHIELGEEEGSFSTLGTLDILMQSDMLHLIFTLEKKVMKFMAQIFPRITFLQGNIKY